MSKNFRAYFYVRSSYKRADGKNPILIRLYLNNERTDLCSTSCFVEKELWDSSKGRVKGRSNEASAINAKLDTMELDLMTIYRRHEFDENLSLDLIKGKFLGKEEEEEKEVTFMNLLDEHIKNLKEEVGITRTISSYSRFSMLKKHFVNFLKKKYKRSDLKLKEVNYKVITDFERYLKTETNYCPNYIARKMKDMKSLINQAKKLGLMDKDPFIDFKIHFQKTNRGFLTEEEIDAIMNKKFTIKRLEQVRDIFVFSIFTGLSYIDVQNLTTENIVTLDGRLWIMIRRHKTDEPSNILLLDIPMKILEKYSKQMQDDEKGRLLPILSNQRMNSYLKEIADVCGINKRLSFHLARHTFATMALTKGMPMESVSKILGHANLKTTAIYARVINKKIEEDMLNLSDKLDNFRRPEDKKKDDKDDDKDEEQEKKKA